MSDRFIEVDTRTWKSPTEQAMLAGIAWKKSAKGNDYTTYGGHVLVVCQPRANNKWTYMTQPDDGNQSYQKWKWATEYFETPDAARLAALRSVMPTRTPVPPVTVESTTTSQTPTTSARKIVL